MLTLTGRVNTLDKVSLMTPPDKFTSPVLRTAMVYTGRSPGRKTLPLTLFVTIMAGWVPALPARTVMTAWLLAGPANCGRLTVAVLVICEPMTAPLSTVAVRVMVAARPGARLKLDNNSGGRPSVPVTPVSSDADTLTGVVRPSGSVSLKAPPDKAISPVLRTTMVYTGRSPRLKLLLFTLLVSVMAANVGIAPAGLGKSVMRASTLARATCLGVRG